MADYRRFTKVDWYAWAGAEKFMGGAEPFIYEREMNDGKVALTIIADNRGIEIDLYSEEDGENTTYNKLMDNMTSIRAEGELKHLIKYIENITYAPDLTYELDHPCADIIKGYTLY